MDGFLFIDKPKGPTSHDVVGLVRRTLGTKKAGHAGTLDPQATGLLVLALGKYTRLLPYLPLVPKTYEFTIQFGSQTDTLDSEGTVVASDGKCPSEVELRGILHKFVGKIKQVPPVYSAIKIAGKRSYQMARSGQDFTLASRLVVIHALELLQFNAESSEARLRMQCDGGTYVRSLARDIADSLGTLGFASQIHRAALGRFTIKDAIPMNSIEYAAKYIIPASEAFRDNPSIAVEKDLASDLICGREIAIPNVAKNTAQEVHKTLFAYFDNEIIAILEHQGEARYRPVRVFCTVLN